MEAFKRFLRHAYNRSFCREMGHDWVEYTALAYGEPYWWGRRCRSCGKWQESIFGTYQDR